MQTEPVSIGVVNFGDMFLSGGDKEIEMCIISLCC